MTCTCHNQLQPHDRMIVCSPVELADPAKLLFGTHPQSVPPPCVPCEDDPGVQHEPTSEEWLDLGGEG